MIIVSPSRWTCHLNPAIFHHSTIQLNNLFLILSIKDSKKVFSLCYFHEKHNFISFNQNNFCPTTLTFRWVEGFQFILILIVTIISPLSTFLSESQTHLLTPNLYPYSLFSYYHRCVGINFEIGFFLTKEHTVQSRED